MPPQNELTVTKINIPSTIPQYFAIFLITKPRKSIKSTIWDAAGRVIFYFSSTPASTLLTNSND